jgi:hypothetical protein
MNIHIPFNSWSKERLLNGTKTATSRTYIMGLIGDTFIIGIKRFKIIDIIRLPLCDVAKNLYKSEGAKSPKEFIQVWESIHPFKGYDPNQMVYYHTFKEIKNDR